MEEERRHTREMMEKVEREELDLVYKAAKGEINPWVERTGWARHLEGQKRRKLTPFIAKPDPEAEPELVEISKRFDKIITVAQKTTMARVGTFTRMEINRKVASTEVKKPFNAYIEEDALKRYRDEFKCVIWYIIRVWMRSQQVMDNDSSYDESSLTKDHLDVVLGPSTPSRACDMGEANDPGSWVGREVVPTPGGYSTYWPALQYTTISYRTAEMARNYHLTSSTTYGGRDRGTGLDFPPFEAGPEHTIQNQFYSHKNHNTTV